MPQVLLRLSQGVWGSYGIAAIHNLE